MRVDRQKLDLSLAVQCKSVTDLRGVLSPATITRIRKGYDVGTKVVGKLAKALDMPVDELVKMEMGQSNE